MAKLVLAAFILFILGTALAKFIKGINNKEPDGVERSSIVTVDEMGSEVAEIALSVYVAMEEKDSDQ
jgi:hypothetical protein